MADDTGVSAPASAAAPSAAPATSTASTSVQPASATVTPETTVSGTPSNEPPRERWGDILHNARTKTRSEVEAEYKQKYGWADEVESNPWGFTQQMLDRLGSHPQYEQQVLQYAARMLNARRAAKGEEPKPDVPVVDQNGQVVSYTYSDKALKALRAFERVQSDQALSQQIAPLKEFVERTQQREQLAELQQQATVQATSRLTELRQNPVFVQHEAAIKRALLEHEDWGDNVDRAYAYVLTTQVLPGEQGKLLSDLQTKAAGGTVNPGASAISQAPKFRTGDFKKDASAAMKYFSEHPAEAEAMARR